ncbi:ABC transporter permease subunit [Thermodesulforhabdus norvegica]|uniref:Branched-chain amino acid transport system permease protein n=1 Tax=Thermodesulforhabdus norvegica TaxID=39841 RepID=A0A1I4TZI2_9BACT|nr:branched-chain amino acid ABC transporter ATP-binding protein/permease [Thermodesulforhabdus norvegica]SFM82021.1 branched-chain amino acid transport system permease protein [Thermodesulforhabdus norvegica]
MRVEKKTAIYFPALICLSLSGLFLPSFIKNDYLFVILNVVAFNGIAVTGLNLLYDATGQVSLGHAVFYGLGAYTTAVLSVTFGLPLWTAWMGSVAMVLVSSFILAFPTLRLHGHYMVMATLGCNIILTVILNQWESLTGGPSGFPGIPELSAGFVELSTDRGFFRLAWIALLGFAFATVALQKSGVGKIFRAIRQNEIATECCGTNTTGYKIFAFVLSALYAGIAGILYAHYMSFISPKTFGVFRSLEWVTMAVVGGMGNVLGGILGAFVLTLLPELLHALEELQVLFYGIVLMSVLILCPQGMVPAIRSLVDRFSALTETEACGDKSLKKKTLRGATPVRAGRNCGKLRIEGLSVNFGGLQALSSVSVTFDPGRIHAVIGPNGAGKTTLFNAVCGIVKPRSGKIFLGDLEITGFSPHKIALSGIGRTFQVPQLYSEFSVRDHVFVGMCVGRLPLNGMIGDDVDEVLRFFDLLELSELKVGEVSLFDKKRIELARALAANPAYILVDEPGGGLNEEEKEAVARYLFALTKVGVTPIVVDHHMDLVMNVAERVVVLHQGQIIADGTPDEIVENPRVADAYLGSRQKVLSGGRVERGCEGCGNA